MLAPTTNANKATSRHPVNLGLRREAAQYISEMTLELRNLAKGHDLLTLQGLLEVAYYEAFTAATLIDLPEGEVEPPKGPQ